MTTPARQDATGSAPAPYDPLRLCVYTTVALIAWLAGPYAVAGFAGLGLVGYLRARQTGLTRSRCVLRDTRLVIGYLASILLLAVGAALWQLTHR